MRLTSLLVLACLAQPALADWEGKVHVKLPKNDQGPSEMTGVMRGKGLKQRTDFKEPMEMSSIIDQKAKKIWNLMHAQKMAIEMSATGAEGQMPMCESTSFESCLVKQGFKKTGQETANGHPCNVYEGEIGKEGDKTKIKIWHPTDLKDVSSVRSLITADKGSVETNITDIKTTKLADSIFSVPKGYKTMNMGDMSNMLRGGAPGTKK